MQKAYFQAARQRKKNSTLHIDGRWAMSVSLSLWPQSSFIIHRTKQTINSAAMYEGWRDATSCEWWEAKNQRPQSFWALMAITSPDSSSKMRLIIRMEPFREDWLNLMSSHITHKYLPHIKQLCLLCCCALISDRYHQIIVSSVVSEIH